MSESRDPEWSSGMEARILAEIAQMSGLAANLVDVDCRASRCRLLLILSPRQTQKTAGSSGNDPGSLVAQQLGLETDRVFLMVDGPGQLVFLTHLRGADGSTTQSLSPDAPA